MPIDRKLEFKKIALILIGSAIYAFAFVYFYMAHKIAANGMAGLTLVGKAVLNIDPIISGYLINLPLVFIGIRFFGKRATVYTVIGVISLYLFVWIFQQFPFLIDLEHDKLVTSLMAGIIAGIGGGVVFRSGGTIGGADIIGKLIETKLDLPFNQALLGIDIFVMILSLTYISLPDMMYALIASFMYGKMVHLVQNGGYSVRGTIIVSDTSAEISTFIMEELGRGVTYLNGEGAYSAREKKVIYAALSRTDVRDLKAVINDIDPRAFVSIFDMDEINSPDFFVPKKKSKKKRKTS